MGDSQTTDQQYTFGQRLADGVANYMGSWKFIIIQSVIVVLWMALNVIGFIKHWDEYPFILLNLLFSTQAAYAAPIIMMSQNRQTEKDVERAENDLQLDKDALILLKELTASIEEIKTKIK